MKRAKGGAMVNAWNASSERKLLTSKLKIIIQSTDTNDGFKAMNNG